MDQHAIKTGTPFQDDDEFYSKYYGITLDQCDRHNMEPIKSNNELEIYITTFDGLLYVKYQIKTIQKFIRSAKFKIIFCDTNSHIHPEVSEQTRQLCIAENVGYVKLPHNKFQDLRSFSNKLGTDLNWIWRNCIKITQPRNFAFFDQDCFIIKDSWSFIKEKLFYKGMYGLAWPQDPTPVYPENWLIHIMNNFFAYDFVKNIDLDFRPAGFIGLDTGGCNYLTLFKDHNRLDYIQNQTELRDFVGEQWKGVFREFTMHDDNRWLHIRNSTQQFTKNPMEKEYKELYMTGILDGILFKS